MSNGNDPTKWSKETHDAWAAWNQKAKEAHQATIEVAKNQHRTLERTMLFARDAMKSMIFDENDHDALEIAAAAWRLADAMNAQLEDREVRANARISAAEDLHRAGEASLKERFDQLREADMRKAASTNN